MASFMPAPLSKADIWASATATDQTASRAADTAYQNTSGAPMFVAVTVYGNGANTTPGILIGPADPPTQPAVPAGIQLPGDRNTMCAIVPAGYYYMLDGDASTVIVKWGETTW